MQHGVLDKRHCLNQWRNFHGLCELVGNVIDTDSWLGGRGGKHSHLYVMMPKIPTQETDRHREGAKWMKWRCWQLGNLGEGGAGVLQSVLPASPCRTETITQWKTDANEPPGNLRHIGTEYEDGANTMEQPQESARQWGKGSHNGETCAHRPSKRVQYGEEIVRWWVLRDVGMANLRCA